MGHQRQWGIPRRQWGIPIPPPSVHVDMEYRYGCVCLFVLRQGSKLSQRVDPKVSNKISQLVAKGILNEKEMKQHLDNYIARELFPGRAKPFHSNRRYYPTKGVIRIKMYNAYIVKRMSMIDLENTEEAVRQWQKVSPDDKFYFRQYNEVNEVLLNGITGISVEEENEDELKIRQKIAKQQVLFAHQTSFQSHLLRRYGNHVCFLDPVYRTVKYALPIFFLTVKTNVDYQIAASFIVQDESKDSTKEALEVLKSWNPDWKPKVFMVDNDAKEIAAVEESFPGLSCRLPKSRRTCLVKFVATSFTATNKLLASNNLVKRRRTPN